LRAADAPGRALWFHHGMADPTPAPSPLGTPEPWDLVSDSYLAEVVPMFEPFARDAMRLAGAAPGQRVLDVAAGPGTLSLLAAAAGARVTAVDFAPAMVDKLRERAAAAGVAIDARVGDGQALPFADATFDRAYCLFGVLFYPDRAAGFRELARVLVPGGRAVVSTWRPMPAPMAAAMEAVQRALGGPGGGVPALLDTPDKLRAEMLAGGFSSVEVVNITYEDRSPSVDAMWAKLERTLAPVVLMKERLGARWPAIADAGRAAMARALDGGPAAMPLDALLAVGAR
jgi:SAM-dependent methyltransferase